MGRTSSMSSTEIFIVHHDDVSDLVKRIADAGIENKPVIEDFSEFQSYLAYNKLSDENRILLSMVLLNTGDSYRFKEEDTYEDIIK